MSIAEILSFAFVTALLIISPGPNGILIAKTVLRPRGVAPVSPIF